MRHKTQARLLSVPLSDSACTRRKSPAMPLWQCRGRNVTRFHLSCSVCRKAACRNLSFDCNVSQRAVLKPLGVGFQMFPAKALSAHGASLCYFPHSTLLVNVFCSILKSYFYCMRNPSKSKGKFQAFFPQHFLYFLPLPQGQGSFLPILWGFRTVPEAFCSL